jgi:hypothetical protein
MCKSQYELDRDANILANDLFLQKIGLSGGMCKKEKKKNNSLCKPRSNEDECITGPQELRRSARIRSLPAPDFPDITNFIDDYDDELSKKFVPKRKRAQALQLNFEKRGKPTISKKEQTRSDNNNIWSVPKTGRGWMYHSMNELLKQQQCAHV